MDSGTEPGLQQMLSALRGGADSDFQQILSRTVTQGRPGAAPASQQSVDALERVQVDNASPPQCPVCFEDITGQAVCATPATGAVCKRVRTSTHLSHLSLWQEIAMHPPLPRGLLAPVAFPYFTE